jgi:hypothetical protein
LSFFGDSSSSEGILVDSFFLGVEDEDEDGMLEDEEDVEEEEGDVEEDNVEEEVEDGDERRSRKGGLS